MQKRDIFVIFPKYSTPNLLKLLSSSYHLQIAMGYIFYLKYMEEKHHRQKSSKKKENAYMQRAVYTK